MINILALAAPQLQKRGNIPKVVYQKFVFAAPQLPSTGPNLLGERLRFSSTSGGWWRVNRFRWRRWNARWRKIALRLIRLRALEQALCSYRESTYLCEYLTRYCQGIGQFVIFFFIFNPRLAGRRLTPSPSRKFAIAKKQIAIST